MACAIISYEEVRSVIRWFVEPCSWMEFFPSQQICDQRAPSYHERREERGAFARSVLNKKYTYRNSDDISTYISTQTNIFKLIRCKRLSFIALFFSNHEENIANFFFNIKWLMYEKFGICLQVNCRSYSINKVHFLQFYFQCFCEWIPFLKSILSSTYSRDKQWFERRCICKNFQS